MGQESFAGEVINAFALPPETGTTYTSQFPPPYPSKAIVSPSGDQQGEPTCCPSREATWIGLPPSAFAIQISGRPERLDANTMRFPSGEYRAALSDSVEAIRATGGAVSLPPCAGQRQML